jgi:hypothetical protein
LADTLNNGTSLDEKKVYAHNGRIVDKAAQLFTYTMITSDVPSPTPGLRYIISFGFIVIVSSWNKTSCGLQRPVTSISTPIYLI